MSQRYVPKHQTQRNPSDPHRTHNCQAYCAAMLFDAATVGGLVIGGALVRTLSSEPVPDPKSPGLNHTQVAAVGKQLHVGLTEARLTQPFDLVDMLRDRRYLSVSGIYGKLPANRRSHPTFVGPHEIAVLALSTSERSILISDPLALAAKWITRAEFTPFLSSLGYQIVYTRRVPNIE